MFSCFKSKETYSLWRDACPASGHKGPPCIDCTPEYQREMVKEMRCAHPEVKFVQGEDGWLEGVFPKKLNSSVALGTAITKIASGTPVKVTFYNQKFSVSKVNIPMPGRLVGVYSSPDPTLIKHDMMETM